MHTHLKSFLGDAKRVGFFGLGASNLSLISMLPRHIRVTLRTDGNILPEQIPEGVSVEAIFEGEKALADLNEDILFLSPSVRRDRPELISAAEAGVVLSSDHELFFEYANAPVLAVSGSSGKSTTAYLTSALINGSTARVIGNPEREPARNAAVGKEKDLADKDASSLNRAVLCGNVGKPMLESISQSAAVYVTELSSFMLMSHKATVRRSAITNISPNHLDFHKSMKEYSESKLSLLRLSEEIIINADDELLSKYAGRSRRVFGVYSARLSLPELLKKHKAKIYMTLEDGYICRNGAKIIDTGRLIRREPHNIANMMCALLLCDGYSDCKLWESVLSQFRGLPHRCEKILEEDGVIYVNSSIDTTPERTATTLRAFSENVILLLGGRGKGLSYEPVFSAMRGRVKKVITFGEEGKGLAADLPSEFCPRYLESFDCAVREACEIATCGDTVLLSPAATSYDGFSSFEERGKRFEELVRRSMIGKNSNI